MQTVISRIVFFLLNTLELWKALKDLKIRVKGLMKNEYMQTVTLLVIVLIGVAGFQLGLRAILKTDYPLAVVESESMVPTLNVGDIIVLQGVDADEIYAASKTANPPGDIIVFYDPRGGVERVYWFFTAPVLIVHRAVQKEDRGGLWYFTTKGDGNQYIDPWKVSETRVVGKVIFRIPLLGHISLFMQSDWGIPTIICLMVALIAIEYLLPEKEKGGEPKEG